MLAGQLPDDRDGFRFRSGNSALDLPATLQQRRSQSPRELLHAPRELARWFVSAGLAHSAPKTTVNDLATARALREAIYVLAGRRHDAEAEGARRTLNRIARTAAAVPRLQATGTMELNGTARALVATLAREAVHLFGTDAVKLIRQCESPSCTLYFLDTSRTGARRWCSMAACGNKAKVSEFRRRQRESNP